MTDTYLRSLGFATTQAERSASRPDFNQAWRYQHEHAAQDGTRLFIEHPLGVDSCRLSTVEAPLAAQDVVASMPLHDKAGLEGAIQAFFAAHGGIGQEQPPFEPYVFRPFRRAR